MPRHWLRSWLGLFLFSIWLALLQCISLAAEVNMTPACRNFLKILDGSQPASFIRNFVKDNIWYVNENGHREEILLLPGKSDGSWYVTTSSRGKDNPIGRISTYLKGLKKDHLRIDRIEIEGPSRKSGIGTLLLAEALSNQPGISVLSASLAFDNLEAFYLAYSRIAKERYPNFSLDPEISTIDELIFSLINDFNVPQVDYQGIAREAMQATPQFKIHKKFGFSQVLEDSLVYFWFENLDRIDLYTSLNKSLKEN